MQWCLAIGAVMTSNDSATSNTKKWAAEGERGNLFALKLITWIALHLGRTVSRFVLIFIVAYFYLTAPKARRASKAYLTRIPNQSTSQWSVYRHLYTFSAVTLDRVYLLNNRLDLFEINTVDENNLALGTASPGAGMFLMGAHMGSFDSVRSIANSHPQLNMVLLMYEDNARNIKQMLQAINPQAQQSIISLGQPNAMLQVRDELSSGSLVGILADRSLEASGNAAVPFLGGSVAFPSGPFRLASMLKRPVFFMVGIFHGRNRYTIHLEPVMDFSSIEPSMRPQAIQQAQLRYAQLMEKHCLESPYNWFNFFDFWEAETSEKVPHVA